MSGTNANDTFAFLLSAGQAGQLKLARLEREDTEEDVFVICVLRPVDETRAEILPIAELICEENGQVRYKGPAQDKPSEH